MSDAIAVLAALDGAEVLSADGSTVSDDAGTLLGRGERATDPDVDEEADETASRDDDGDDDVGPARAFDMAVVERCASLDPSDTDNGTRLIAHLGCDLTVRGQEGGKAPLWCGWNGSYWDDVSGTAAATRAAQQIGEAIKLEAHFKRPTPSEQAAIDAGRGLRSKPSGELTDAEERLIEAADAAAYEVEKRKAARVKFGVSSKNQAKVNAMMAMAAPHLLRDPDAFNADPLVVATASHTLRFHREVAGDGSSDRVVSVTAEEGHRREDLITRMVPIAWNPAAPAPRWRAFVERFLPKEDVRRFVQVAVGLGLLGLTEQVLVFHYGNGANGKSVFLEVVSRVLGPLAAGLPAESIAGDERGGGLKASPEIARLYGVRFVRIAEIPEGVSMREEFVKRITGGERFPARNLFEGFFEFLPIFIAHMSGNGYPRIVGKDNGIWRRMRVVRWPVELEAKEMRNFADVIGELMEEAEGILAWIAEGARIYLEEGLVAPPDVLHETEKMRDHNDPVARFFDHAVELTGSEADTVTGQEIREAYVAYAEGDHTAVNPTRFGLNFTKIAEAKGAVKERGAVVLYRGIRLKPRPATPLRGDPGWSPNDGR